jgi:hypothetical protein
MRFAYLALIVWFVVGQLLLGAGLTLAVVALWKALCLAGWI